MSRPTVEAPEWLAAAPIARAILLNVWDGAPSLMLVPYMDGAIAWWQFDQGPDGSEYVLLAHVTESEAQAIYEGAPGDGAFEAVRSTIADDRIVIARRHPDFMAPMLVTRMPRTISEQEFSEQLASVRTEIDRQPTQPMRRRKRKLESTSPVDQLAEFARTTAV